MDSFQPTSPDIEQIVPGVTLERLHDDQAFIFTISDISRVVIDAWAGKIKDLTRDWPDDRTFFAVNHFDGKRLNLTPYMRAKIQQLADWQPERRGYIAGVLPRTFFAQLMTLFLATMKRNNMTTRFFFTREEALVWLETAMKKEMVR